MPEKPEYTMFFFCIMVPFFFDAPLVLSVQVVFNRLDEAFW